MHLAPLIQDLALILICAAIVAAIFHRLRQPVVVGYLLAGVLVGPHSFLANSPLSDLPNIKVWAEIGVIFLMFHLGLEFSFARFRKLGFGIAAVGVAEVMLMIGAGWLFARAVGFGGAEALFIGSLVSISSTTIIVKTLDEFGLKTRRFADTVLGILIIEDLLAVLILVLLGAYATDRHVEGARLFTLVPELFVVIGGWMILGSFIVPRLMRYVGRFESDEILTLLSIGLCLALAATAVHFHYSTALGAFIMGAIIGETKEAKRVTNLVHPMRDLFAAIFFVSAGMLADFHSILRQMPLILALVLLVMIGKLVVVFASALAGGQSLRTSIRAAMSMGQIGEFSFIIAALGISSGLMSPNLQAVIVGVSLVTSFTTAYMIRWSDPFSAWAESRLSPEHRERLTSYAVWVAVKRQRPLLPLWLRSGLGRWLLNAIMVGTVFGLNNRVLRPWMEPWLSNAIREPLLAKSASFCTALLFASPFIYAMLNASRPTPALTSGRTFGKREAGMRTFFYLLLSTLWLGALSAQYLSAFASASITLILIACLAGFFYRRLQISYAWLEGRFLSGLEKEESASQRAMRELAPWDSHLVSAVVHPNSALMGLPLHRTGLRQKFGLIIVAIRRGTSLIGMPASTELLLPHDEILLLGTDEEIESALPVLEGPSRDRPPSVSDFSDYITRTMIVDERSPLCDRTIVEARFRESHGALIVGVERDSHRWIAPPPAFKILKGDIVWLAGERKRLSEING